MVQQPGLRDLTVQQDQLVQLAFKEPREHRDRLVQPVMLLLGRKVSSVHRGQLGHRVRLERKVQEDHREQLDHRVPLVRRAATVQLVHRGQLVLPDHRVRLAYREQLVQLVHWGQRVLRVLLEILVHKDHREQRDYRAQLGD